MYWNPYLSDITTIDIMLPTMTYRFNNGEGQPNLPTFIGVNLFAWDYSAQILDNFPSIVHPLTQPFNIRTFASVSRF